MTQRNLDRLTESHKWITVTAIPALLTVILYFLYKIDQKIDVAADGVIRHEQRLDDHENRMTHMEQYVYRSK